MLIYTFPMPTKKQIAEVALDLFMKDGYNGVSIKNITDALSITKGSLYYHYEGKEALFKETVDLFLEKIYGRFGIRLPVEVESTAGMFKFFKHLFNDAVDFLGESSYDVGYIHMIIQGKKESEALKEIITLRYDEVKATILRILEDDIKKGVITLNCDLESFALGVMSVFEGFILMWMKTNDPSLKQSLSDLFDAQLKAIAK